MVETANLFQLANPEVCLCFVSSYIASHSQLYIEIRQPGETESVYVTFQAVEYFEGPLSWVGANFSMGDPRDCIKFLRLSSSRHKELKDSQLIAKFHLFLMPLSHPKSEGNSIKIVAAIGGLVPNPHQ